MFQFRRLALSRVLYLQYSGLSHSEIYGYIACVQLPVAYRSLPRPSSPLKAKASAMCPYVALKKLKLRSVTTTKKITRFTTFIFPICQRAIPNKRDCRCADCESQTTNKTLCHIRLSNSESSILKKNFLWRRTDSNR
jgi:hypothetical protein